MMFAVLFEVRIKASQWDRYLELAAGLRPELVEVPGFLENERYASERTERKLLSVSLWDSERAVTRWRTHARHHEIQHLGRFEVFDDYQLRVAEVVEDTVAGTMPPTRSEVTEAGRAKAVTVSEVAPGEAGMADAPSSSDVVDAERYSGITTTGKRLLLVSWRTDEPAARWLAAAPEGPRHRHLRVVRDYGMHERDEAPQHFPPVGAER